MGEVVVPLYITVTFPVPVEKIPDELRRLRDHIRTLDSARNVTAAMITAVQNQCPHKETSSYNDRSGTGCTVCKRCDKEW